MRFKLTIVLLLANLVVFFALWRLERPAPVTLKPSGLMDFAPTHITINDHVQKEVRELVRDPGGAWRLVQPVKWAADENAVQHIINALATPEEMSHFQADDLPSATNPLAEYGLDKPRLDITITGPNGKNVSLEVGSGTPAGNNLYVMNPADKQVRVWTQDFYKTMQMPVAALRDNSIFSIPFFEVQGLSIWSPKLVKFSRDPHNNDYWQLDTPLQRPADTMQVNRVVQQLRSLRALNFLAPADINLEREGLANPALRVELKGENRSQTLLLGGPVPNTTDVPQIYAKRDDSDAVFTLAASGVLIDTLGKAQEKLRERHFLDFSPDKVTAITIRILDAEMRLLKTEDGANPWRLQMQDTGSNAPTTIVADKGVVQSLLDSLHGLTAKGFASDAPDDLSIYGLAHPTWKVTLQIDKGAPLVLDIGHDKSTPYKYYAKVENADSVYEIDGDITGDLTDAINPLHFRDRVLETLPASAQVISLKLTRLKDDGSDDGAPIFNFAADSAKGLDDLLKSQPPEIRTNVQALAQWLHSAAVDGYAKATFDEHTPFQFTLGDSAVPTPAPWRYRLEAGILIPAAGETPAQNQNFTLYLTELIGAHQYGGTHTPEAIVDLPISIIKLLGALTQNASLPPAAQETLQKQDQPIDPHAALPAPQVTMPDLTNPAPPTGTSLTPAVSAPSATAAPAASATP